jgi:hypothetical protein
MSSPADDSLARAEALLQRLAETRTRLEGTDDPEVAIEVMTELSEIAKEIQAEIERAKREAEAG